MTGEVHSALTNIGILRTIKEPIKQIKKLVDFATEKFAWGLDALGALVGSNGKRALGVKLAKSESAGGGPVCEFKELLNEAKKLKLARENEPEDKKKITKLENNAAGEAADVITMVFALIQRLGISDKSLDNALKTTSTKKYCDRFDNVLEFVKRKYIKLKDIASTADADQLKKNGKLFNVLWCAVKKHEEQLKASPGLFDTLWRAYKKYPLICEQDPSKFFEQLWDKIGANNNTNADQGFVPA